MATAAEIVAACDAEILRRIEGGIPQKRSINGRLAEDMPLSEIQSTRTFYAAQAAADSAAAGDTKPLKQWGVRYGRPT